MQTIVILLYLLMVPLSIKTMAVHDKILSKDVAVKMTRTPPRPRPTALRTLNRQNFPKFIYQNYPELLECFKTNNKNLINILPEVSRPIKPRPSQLRRPNQQIFNQKGTKQVIPDLKKEKVIPKNSNIIFIPFNKPWNPQNFIDNRRRFNTTSNKEKSLFPVKNYNQYKQTKGSFINNKDSNIQQRINIDKSPIFTNNTLEKNHRNEFVLNKTNEVLSFNKPTEENYTQKEVNNTKIKELKNVNDDSKLFQQIVSENEKNLIKPDTVVVPLQPTKSFLQAPNLNESQFQSYEVEEIIDENVSVDINYDHISNFTSKGDKFLSSETQHISPVNIQPMEFSDHLSEMKDSIGTILQDLVGHVKINTTPKSTEKEIISHFGTDEQNGFLYRQKVEKPNQNSYYFPNLFNKVKSFLKQEDTKKGKVLVPPENFITNKNTMNVLPESILEKTENILKSSPEPFNKTTYFLKYKNNYTPNNNFLNTNTTTQKYDQSLLKKKTEKPLVLISTENLKNFVDINKTIFQNTMEKPEKILMASPKPLYTSTTNSFLNISKTKSNSKSLTDVFQKINLTTRKNDQNLVTLKNETTKKNSTPTNIFKIPYTIPTITQSVTEITKKNLTTSVKPHAPPTVNRELTTNNYTSFYTHTSTDKFQNIDLITPKNDQGFFVKLPIPQDQQNHMSVPPNSNTQTTAIFSDDIIVSQTWKTDNLEKTSDYDSVPLFLSFPFGDFDNSETTTENSDQGLLIKLPLPKNYQNENLNILSTESNKQMTVKNFEEDDIASIQSFLKPTQKNSEKVSDEYKNLQNSYETKTDFLSKYYFDYSENFENKNNELLITDKPTNFKTEEPFTLNFNEYKSETEFISPDKKLTFQTSFTLPNVLNIPLTSVETESFLNYYTQKTTENPDVIYSSDKFVSKGHIYEDYFHVSMKHQDSVSETNLPNNHKDFTATTKESYKGDAEFSTKPDDSKFEINFSNKPKDFTTEVINLDEEYSDVSKQFRDFEFEIKLQEKSKDSTTENIHLFEEYSDMPTQYNDSKFQTNLPNEVKSFPTETISLNKNEIDASVNSADPKFKTNFPSPKDISTDAYMEDLIGEYDNLDMYSTDEFEYMENSFENDLEMKPDISESRIYPTTTTEKQLTDTLNFILDMPTIEPETKTEYNLETNWKNSRKMHFNQDPSKILITNSVNNLEQQRRSDILINDTIEDYSENTHFITSPNYTEELAHKNLLTENLSIDSIIPMIPRVITDLRTNKISSEDSRTLSQKFGKYWPFILKLSDITNLDMLPLFKMKNEEDLKKVLQTFGMKLDVEPTVKAIGEDMDYDSMYNFMNEYEEMYQDVLENEETTVKDVQRSKRQEEDNSGMETLLDYYENVKERHHAHNEYVYEDILYDDESDESDFSFIELMKIAKLHKKTRNLT